jgi:hypothetical protein
MFRTLPTSADEIEADGEHLILTVWCPITRSA